MFIASLPIALLLSFATSQPDPAAYLGGSWVTEVPRGPVESRSLRVTFSAHQIIWSTHAEPIRNMSQQGDLIRVGAGQGSTYAFERIGPDSMCMVTPVVPGVIVVPHPGSDGVRPSLRDGLKTNACFRRATTSG